MANDKGVLSIIRRSVDRVLGEGMTHTLFYRSPELFRIRAEHFSENLSLERCRALFAASIRLIEIETHSYCNRTCWFCPNAHIDRRSTRHYLPQETFAQILADLRSIAYRRKISFSRYNEPFGDDIIFERFEETRRALPKCKIVVYSNGDFLTNEKLQRTAKLGVNELNLGIYLPNGTSWSAALAEAYLRRAIERLGLLTRRRFEAPGERISYSSSTASLKINIFCPNYAKHGCDRGGSVNGVPLPLMPRTSPCLFSVTDLYIDFNGQVMPCCHLRSDVAAHNGCQFGRVDHTPGSIFAIWGGKDAARWRKALCQFSPKLGPCANCTARPLADTPIIRRLLLRILDRASPSSS